MLTAALCIGAIACGVACYQLGLRGERSRWTDLITRKSYSTGIDNEEFRAEVLSACSEVDRDGWRDDI